ncbi:MAG: VPLPA-CTERM sorting domain-containing protein [Chromatiales bacterium]|jgi:hypothetical protein
MAALNSYNAQSALISVDFLDVVNDCPTYFGDGDFSSCNIEGLSPVIAKFEYENESFTISSEDINTLYPSIDGSEFTLTPDLNSDEANTGSWLYAPDDQADPSVRFWVAKSSTDFRLFWEVSTADATGVCATNPYIIDCLDAALVVTSGTWSTVDEKGLSHITFYDTGAPVSPVPLPAAAWLFGAALLGMAGIARRRTKRTANA